jgi:murein DD-endopeptidase MepM/ murein hydrolase activator NlpD
MNISFLRYIALALACMLLLGACSSQPTTSAPTAMPTATNAPTATASPTATPEPSATPTATAKPTSTSTPTATSAPSATATVTAIPAATATAAPSVPADPTAETGSGSAGFRYVFPVRSEGEISYGRTHHDYPATDIFCPIGSDFVAATDGVVDFVSVEDLWDARSDDPAVRGGISVAIVGDDGVRYYGSHLSEVAEGIVPGLRVEAGQLLGRTGNSGNAASTPPHLHFGISHPTTPDDWQVRRGEISPYTYLRAWQRGENVTPELP